MLSGSALRRRSRVLAPALLLALALPASASAAAPLAGAGGFTVFSAGGATVTSNENDGSMAIGGDLTLPAGGDYRVGNNNPSPYTAAGTSARTALYVGGTAKFAGGKVTVNGNQYARIVNGTGLNGVRSGGTATITPAVGTGSISLNTGQPASTMFGAPTNAINFTSAFASLRAEADTYATYAHRHHAGQRQRRHARLDDHHGQPVRAADQRDQRLAPHGRRS